MPFCTNHIIYHNIYQALDVLLRHPDSVGCFLDGGLLPALINMAQPYTLTMESSSFDKLEEKALFLDEKCFEFGAKIHADSGNDYFIGEVVAPKPNTRFSSKGKERDKEEEYEESVKETDKDAFAQEPETTEQMIPYSPFRCLPFKLPTRLVSEGTTNIQIDEDDYRIFTCLWYVFPAFVICQGNCVMIFLFDCSRSGSASDVMILHSDVPIPDALPSFYFEIRILEERRRAHNNGCVSLSSGKRSICFGSKRV